ncbi:MAG: TetR/AcrR family transcriptional regulator [Calditrichota bacterium]
MIHAERNRRQIILDEAAELFRERGYRATSMRDLAEKVGIEAASLYNHINSKQQLLCELLMQIAELFTEGMQKIDSLDVSPTEKLNKLISLHVKLTVEHPKPIGLLTGEWIHLEEPVQDEFLKLRNDYEAKFIKILEAGIEQNELESVDPRIAMFSILSTLHGLQSWYRRNKDMGFKELEEAMQQCLLRGLKK